MLELLKVRRARKAAVATITPLVESSRWRFHGIPEMVWLDPYVIGFMAMLITLIARNEVRSLGGQALGLVQLDAWGAITKAVNVNVGEEICLLSADGDAEFQTGCVNAEQMFRAIQDASGGDEEQETDESNTSTASISSLWSRYFEERLVANASCSIEPG